MLETGYGLCHLPFLRDLPWVEANAATTPITASRITCSSISFIHSIGLFGMKFMGVIIEIYVNQLLLWVPEIIDFSSWRVTQCRMCYKRYCSGRNLVGSNSGSVVNEVFYRLSTT